MSLKPEVTSMIEEFRECEKKLLAILGRVGDIGSEYTDYTDDIVPVVELEELLMVAIIALKRTRRQTPRMLEWAKKQDASQWMWKPDKG